MIICLCVMTSTPSVTSGVLGYDGLVSCWISPQIYHVYSGDFWELLGNSYDRLEVPFHRLSVVIVGTVSEFRVEIAGFPRTATPVLYRTSNLEMAQRCAREAGQWLQLPYHRAA